MSCDSHSLGDIPGESSATITLQSILVPSTNIDDVDTDDLPWGLDSILPVHTTEEELRGLANVAVTDHAYAIPANREPRDHSSPLMTSRSVQTPFEHSDDDQSIQAGQEIACSDPDAAATIAALVAGVPEETFTTYSIYVPNNDTIHNVTEAMLSSLQLQKQEEEEDEDETPPLSESDTPKKEISPAVTPTNIRRSIKINETKQKEFEEEEEEDSEKEMNSLGILKTSQTSQLLMPEGLAASTASSEAQINQTKEIAVAGTDSQGNIICFLQPLTTSTPMKPLEEEAGTPPSTGRGRGRGQRGRGKRGGGAAVEASPVRPGATGQATTGKGAGKAATSRGRGATPAGRGRGRGRGGGSGGSGRKKKVKDETESEESVNIPKTDQSTSDVLASPEVLPDTLLAGRPKRRPIKNRKYVKDSDSETEKPKAKKPGRPPKKNAKKDDQAPPKGASEANTPKESESNTPVKMKGGRGGKKTTSKMMTSADDQLSKTDDISTTDVSMDTTNLSKNDQVSIVSQTTETSLEEPTQTDISSIMQELDASQAIPSLSLNKSERTDSNNISNNLMDDTDFLINSINLSLNDSKIDTTSSEESVLSHLIKKPTTIAKKGAVNVRKAGRGARQGLASGGRGKKGKSKAPLSSEADSTPDVSFVGKKKKVKVKEVERKKKKKKNEVGQTDVVEKKKKKKIKKKKKKEEIEDKSEPEEEEEVDTDKGDMSKAVPLMKTGRPKRQARIRKEEREKAAKASELEAKKKKKLRKKNRDLMESDDDYIDTDDDDDSDDDDDDSDDESDDDDDIDDSDDDEEVPLLRLKKQQSSAKGKKMSLEHSKLPPPLPAKKTPKLGKKAAALQAKVDQVEKERLEEEKARQAADEKARAEQKARAEKEAKKLRKMRKSEESLDKTMTDLFKPDGVILHESSALTKKDSDSEIHIEHISQILSDKSGHSITSTNEVQTNKTVGPSEATNKAALTPTLSKASPKLVQAKTDDQSAVSAAKTSTIHKGPTSSVPFPKSVASKSPTSTNNTITTTLITSGESIVAASTVSASPTSPKLIDKPVNNVTNSNNTGLSPIKEKVTSPVTTPKVASSKVDSQTPKKTPPFSLKERHSGEKRKEKLVANETEPVQMEAQTTMNEKLANDNATKVSVSIGCQADEDSEYEYASCTEEADDDSQLEAKSRGKACSICSMVQDNQYLVNCDICKKSFHGHCAELTLEDMQRILQDGEKFVCDNCPIDGASGAAVSTTDTLKEEDMPNIATINATTPVDVPAVHSTEQSSEKISPTSTKQIKEKKQRSEEVAKSSPVKTAVKDLVSTSSTTSVAVKKAPPPSDHKKEVLSASNQESFPKKDSLALAIRSLPKIPKKSSSETKALPKSSKEANREKERRREKERLKSSSKEQKRKESSSQHQSSKESKNRKNSKERSDSSSHREKKASSSKDKKESLNRNKHRVSSKDKRESKDYTSTPPTTKTFGSMTARKHEVSSAHVSSSTGQTNESDKKSSSDGLKKKKLLHFKDVDLKKRTFQQCIGTGCKHDARPGSVYCSDDCIVRHAQESLALLKNERHWQQTGQKLTNKTVLQQISPSPAPPPPPPPPAPQQQQQQEKQQVQQQPQQSQEKQPLQQAQQQAQQSQQQVQQQKKDNSSKVVVLERKTGRILTGPTAPTESGLKEWLTEHPTFEVLQPSQSVHKSSSLYNKEKRQVNSERRHSSEQKKRDSDSKLSSHSVKGTDDVRHNVRKSLHEALTNRAQEAENVIKSNTELKQLVFSIEAELYKLYNDSGHKYKARYRSLIFNIKDTNNKGLFRKILSRSIKPHRLVRMTADELASSELAQWRQKEAKHTLELIEQREVEAIKDAAKAHVVKKTHKGEVDVIDEDLSTLEVKSVPVEKIRIHPKADVIGGIVNDTTESHRTHLFDLNCKICTGKMAPPSDEPPSKKSKREAASSSAGQSEANKSSKSATSKSEKKSTSKSEADLLKEEEVKNVIESIRAVTQQVEATANEIKASPGSPLPSAMKTSRNVTVRSPDSVLQSGLEKKVKFSPSSPLVWKGFIHMQDLVKFMTTAYRMSGPTEHLELQDTIHVCGRIAPELIWDYLTRIKQTGSRDICVLRFLPGSFDEKNAYVTLYSYLNSRGRCGVVGNNSRHIKDMYIVPLASHSKIPPLLLPFDEPGLEDNRPHMLLGVIVRQKVTKRPVEQLSSTSQANLASDNDAQTKRLKYDPNLPSTTIKVDSLSSQQPAKYDPMQPATLPPKYPVATQRGDDASSADTQPTSSAILPELKEKYYNTPSATYTPSPVVNVKTDRFKQPSPSPVDSSTSDSPPDAIGSRINDPIVKAFGKMEAISEPVNTTPVEDLSAAPYSPTQYDPDPTSSLGPQTDNSVSTSNNNNNNNNNNVSIANKDGTIDNNDYPMLDDEKPYDPEECDFEASEDSPPPPPPPPPTISTTTTTTAASVPLKGTVMGITAASTSSSAPKPSAVSMDKIFDQIKMSTLSPGVTAIMSTVSNQSSKAEKKDLITELTQRVGEKKTDAPLPKPSTAGLPTALQNLFSQVSKVSMTSNLTPNLGTGIPPIPSTTSTVLPINLPSVTQASTLASIQLPQSSLVVTSSNKLSSSTFTVNTSTPPLTKSNAKDITKTTVSESSHLSQNLAIPGVKKEQALSSLMQRSNLPPISETGWSTIAQTLASLAKVQKTNLTSQIPSTKTTTSVSNAPSIITKSSGADGSNHSPSSVDFKNISESPKTTPNIPQKDVFASGPSDAKQTKTSTYSASKAPDGGKLSSVRIAFSTGPKHPLVPHAAFKEEEKPKMHSLFSETKIPGLGGLDEEEEEEKEVRSSSATTTTTAAPKDNAFLPRAKFDALSSIAKTDSFLAGGLRSDSFISNWKGINIGSKDGASQPLKGDETKQGAFDPAKTATEQQQAPAAAAVVKVQQDNQVEIARSRSDMHSETVPSSSSSKMKPESSSNKDVGKQRYESTSSSKNRESHHDSKSRLSHDASKESRRRSDSDRKRSSSGSGHHSDSGSSSSKNSRYSDRSDRHGHSRHSRSRDYSDKRDRDYRKDYGSSDHRSRDRDHERDRDYDHGSSSKSKDRGSDRKDHRRSSSSGKSDDRTGSKKTSDKSDKFGNSLLNEDSNKYGDVDERKKGYGASSSYLDSANRFTAEKKEMPSSLDGSSKTYKTSVKKEADDTFKNLQLPNQDQDLRKSLVPNVVPPPGGVVPSGAQPIPTLMSSSLDEFPSDVDHRKHGLSWPALYEHKTKDVPENEPSASVGSLWTNRGDIDYRSQSNPSAVVPRNLPPPPPPPPHNQGSAIAGWSNTVPPPPHMGPASLASFQSISTVLNQRPLTGKLPIEPNSQTDQDMRKPAIAPQKIEVILPRPTAKDFFGTTDSESSDSMSQSPSNFDPESARQRMPGTFIAPPSGNTNESQNNLRVVLQNWNNAMVQEKLCPNILAPSTTTASISTPQDVDDRRNIYRKVGLSPAVTVGQSNLLSAEANSSSKVINPPPPVDAVHPQDPAMATPDVKYYSTGPPPAPPSTPHSSHLEHIVTSTTVVSSSPCASPQETRPVKSVAPTPPAAVTPLPVITQELPKSRILTQNPTTYGPSQLQPHSEFAPSSHIQSVVEAAATERLKPKAQWEGQQPTPQNIPDHNPHQQPLAPPQHDTQKNNSSIPTTTSSSSISSSSSNPNSQSHTLVSNWPSQPNPSSSGQAPILSSNEFYETQPSSSSDPTTSSSPSSSAVTGLSPIDTPPQMGASSPLSSVRAPPPPMAGGVRLAPPTPPPVQSYPGSGPQHHPAGQFVGPHSQSGHGYHLSSRTDYHQAEQHGPRTFAGPRHPFRAPGVVNFQSGHGSRMEHGGNASHFPHQRQGSRFN